MLLSHILMDGQALLLFMHSILFPYMISILLQGLQLNLKCNGCTCFYDRPVRVVKCDMNNKEIVTSFEKEVNDVAFFLILLICRNLHLSMEKTGFYIIKNVAGLGLTSKYSRARLIRMANARKIRAN